MGTNINNDSSMFKKGLLVIVALASLPISYNATAHENVTKKKLLHVTSGTGFYINNNQIVTNEHVVKDCKYIKVRGAVKPTNATVAFKDTVNDLAVLRTSASPRRSAKLSGKDIPLKVGEDVTIMGYPLEHGINGDHIVKKGSITDTEDTFQGIKRIQFTDSVEKGNSGGPLLDKSGNVVGVVVGKMSFYLTDANMSEEKSKPVKTSSVAINLESLTQFLDANNVTYRTTEFNQNISDQWSDQWTESKAKEYIVNVLCIKDAPEKQL